ncbi:hypothetical protein IscW_ISCW013568 [Ixodes scapularis]|uniref:Uncharacterized protein n=1 Tax=Ixodes scapularis TaxID=6945 RepID=B7QJH8_IXOSC|nr:hypothetical protein IscW_ISCW013568 [Ixodes scapularis]|eukprot:XP_002415335.1 hypothetical protein IscW_ISCW013568 [Ixodes scapularis]
MSFCSITDSRRKVKDLHAKFPTLRQATLVRPNVKGAQVHYGECAYVKASGLPVTRMPQGTKSWKHTHRGLYQTTAEPV